MDKIAQLDKDIASLQSDRNRLQNALYMLEAGVEKGEKRLVGQGFHGLCPGYVIEATFTHVGGGILHFDNRAHPHFYSDSVWRSCAFPYNPVIQRISDFLENERASL